MPACLPARPDLPPPDYDGRSTLPPAKSPHSYPRLKLITFLWTCLGPYSRPYICPFFPRILGSALAVPFAAISPHTNMPAATAPSPRGVIHQWEPTWICVDQWEPSLEPVMVALIDGRLGSQWLGPTPRGASRVDVARRSATARR